MMQQFFVISPTHEVITQHFKCSFGGLATSPYSYQHAGYKGAKDIGIESFLECLEQKPKSCQFSVSFGLMHLCQCPLRGYLYKKLKK